MSNIQSERDQLAESLTRLVKGIMAFSEGESLNYLAEEDLTFTQIRTLLLASSGEPLGISQVAESLGLSITAASRGVDSLVRLGLLARRTSEEDRRAKIVTITDKGLGMLSDHREAHERALALFVESLPPEHIGALSDALQPIISDPDFAERSRVGFCE